MGSGAQVLVFAKAGLQPPLRETLADFDSSIVAYQFIEHREDEDLESRVRRETADTSHLFCIGIGELAWLALEQGILHGATAIMAFLPPFSPPEHVLKLLLDAALALPDQTIDVVFSAEGLDEGTRHVRTAQLGDKVQVTWCALGFDAGIMAVSQSEILSEIITAWVTGNEGYDLRDLPASWCRRFAHVITVNPDDSIEDAVGNLWLSGNLKNVSPNALNLGFASDSGVKIGARVTKGKSKAIASEARAALPVRVLAPGRSVPFRLLLPNVADADDVTIGLVCEGRFWFSEMGFASVTLGVRSGSE